LKLIKKLTFCFEGIAETGRRFMFPLLRVLGTGTHDRLEVIEADAM
jgi:hypothetical protein